MKSPNEFWLCLHELAEAYQAEAQSQAERHETIVQCFQQMPNVAKREVMAEFVELLTFLPDLYPHIINEPKQTPSSKTSAQRRDGVA